MKATAILLGLLLLLVVFAGCAPGANEQLATSNADGIIAGFWRGLWHGLIVPITFVISLFSDHVQIYEVHNSGGWYNFGYVLGAMCAFGGGGGAAQSRRGRT